MKLVALLLIVLLMTSCTGTGTAAAPDGAVPESITLYREQAGEIVTLDFREYVTGCLFGSISPCEDDEALKAVAVIAAGNALYKLQNGEKHLGADLTDADVGYVTPEEAEQLYGSSYSYYSGKVRQAVEYGVAHALMYEGEAVYAPFCAISTGKTDDGGVPWLPSVEVYADRDCEQGSSSAAHSDTQVMRMLGAMMGVTSLPARREQWFSDAEYTDGGTLRFIRFGGAMLTGEQLRAAFELRSTAISVEYSEERFVFRARGIGCNKGLSVNGAAAMAKGGMTAEQILAYFYPNTKLVQLT